MKTRNLVLAAFAAAAAILVLLIVIKLTSGVEKPAQRNLVIKIKLTPG